MPVHPDALTIGCSFDSPFLPTVPLDWTLPQRSGRLKVHNPSGVTCQLEWTHDCVLELVNQRMDEAAFLESLIAVSSLKSGKMAPRLSIGAGKFLPAMPGSSQGTDLLSRVDALHALLKVLFTAQ